MPGGSAVSSREVFDRKVVDMGAASHPFGVTSPAFRELGLTDYVLTWLNAPFEVAHPLEGQETALLVRSLTDTAEDLGEDSCSWMRLYSPMTHYIDDHLANLLGPPLRWPLHPVRLAQFGMLGALSASALGKSLFSTERARALFAGCAAHAIKYPTTPFMGAFGLLFGALGMTRGWPVAEKGIKPSQIHYWL